MSSDGKNSAISSSGGTNKLTPTEIKSAVLRAMAALGFTLTNPSELLTDGRPHYYRSPGDERNEKRLWAVVHLGDHPRASFGHFVGNRRGGWTASTNCRLSPRECRRMEERILKEDRRQKMESRERHRKGMKLARAAWRAASEASKSHAYAKRKQITPIGLRRLDGRLLVPMRDVEGHLSGYQSIDAAGKKRFAPGVRAAGLYFSVGGPITDKVILAEGAATAITLHIDTGHPVVAALSCGNMERVGVGLRFKYPMAEIIVAADNDQEKTNRDRSNVGVQAATAVARLVDGKLAVPTFDRELTELSDFNDLHILKGAQAVRSAISAATFIDDLPSPETLSLHSTTDQANACRLYARFGRDFMFVPAHGWYRWAPGWRRHEEGLLSQAMQLSSMILGEIGNIATIGSDSARVGELTAWAKRSESRSKINNATSLAQTMLTRSPSKLDINPVLFGCPNGVLDLRDISFRPHRRTDFITKVAGCEYRPHATAPKWARFIAETYRNDRILIDYVQRLLGYALLGDRREHILVIFHGDGRNGKGTVLELMQHVLGDYARTAQPDLLMRRSSDRHLTELADLAGHRLVVCTESGQRSKLFVDRVKALTGEDRISARRTHENAFEFKPQHMLILQTNHLPVVNETDKGTWRRIRVIPHDATISDKREDKNLRSALRREESGILNWLIEGLNRYRWYGLEKLPRRVRVATISYRNTCCPVRRFLIERCEHGPDYRVTSTSLFDTFIRWAKEKGEAAMTKQAFGRELKRLGKKPCRTSKKRSWAGVRMKKP